MGSILPGERSSIHSGPTPTPPQTSSDDTQTRNQSIFSRVKTKLSGTSTKGAGQTDHTEKITHVSMDAMQPLKTPGLLRRIAHVVKKPGTVVAQDRGKTNERIQVLVGQKQRLTKTKQMESVKAVCVGGRLSQPELEASIRKSLGDFGTVENKVKQQIEQKFRGAGISVDSEKLKNMTDAILPLVIENAEKIKPGLKNQILSQVRPSLVGKPEISVDALKVCMNPSFTSGSLSDTELKALAKTLSNETLSSKEQVDAAHDLTKRMMKIDQLISQPLNMKPGDVNKELLSEIRGALNSDAYKALKEDETNPAVRILHDLCTAGFLEAPVMDAYTSLHDDLTESSGAPELPTQAQGHELPGLLQTFRQFIHKKGVHQADMNNPLYLFQRTGSAKGAFQSQKQHLGYDPRLSLENQAGACFDEKFEVGGKSTSIRHFFSPAWRVDVKPPPEARAMLQSMTNRLARSLADDDHVASQVNYNNLQNIAKHVDKDTEAKSSVNIMKLCKEYPDAFRANTIPCDTDFHNRGLGHGAKMWDNLYGGEGQEPKEMELFSKDLRNVLHNPANFTLEKRHRDGTGYYFHARNDEERAMWTDGLNKICNHLQIEYTKRQNLPKNRELLQALQSGTMNSQQKKRWWQLESAMIEEANMAISTLSSAISQKAIEGNSSKGQSMISVCKELADRGKNSTVEKMYAQCLSDTISEDELKAMMAIEEGRPMMARYRVGLEHRNQAGMALLMNRTPSELRATKDIVLQAIFGEGAKSDEGFKVVRQNLTL